MPPSSRPGCEGERRCRHVPVLGGVQPCIYPRAGSGQPLVPGPAAPADRAWPSGCQEEHAVAQSVTGDGVPLHVVVGRHDLEYRCSGTADSTGLAEGSAGVTPTRTGRSGCVHRGLLPKTMVWLPCWMMRSWQCHRTARESTARSTLEPRFVTATTASPPTTATPPPTTDPPDAPPHQG